MLSVSTPNGKNFIRAGPFIFNERILTDVAFPNPEPALCGIDDKAGKRRALLNFFVAQVALIQDGFGRAESAVERGIFDAALLSFTNTGDGYIITTWNIPLWGIAR